VYALDTWRRSLRICRKPTRKGHRMPKRMLWKITWRVLRRMPLGKDIALVFLFLYIELPPVKGRARTAFLALV
jgi:hypothetical protein